MSRSHLFNLEFLSSTILCQLDEQLRELRHGLRVFRYSAERTTSDGTKVEAATVRCVELAARHRERDHLKHGLHYGESDVPSEPLQFCNFDNTGPDMRPIQALMLFVIATPVTIF